MLQELAGSPPGMGAGVATARIARVEIAKSLENMVAVVVSKTEVRTTAGCSLSRLIVGAPFYMRFHQPFDKRTPRSGQGVSCRVAYYKLPICMV